MFYEFLLLLNDKFVCKMKMNEIILYLLIFFLCIDIFGFILDLEK